LSLCKGYAEDQWEWLDGGITEMWTGQKTSMDTGDVWPMKGETLPILGMAQIPRTRRQGKSVRKLGATLQRLPLRRAASR
jgi:hypothetical protein